MHRPLVSMLRLLMLSAFALPATAGTVVTISGNSAIADIALSGRSAEVTLVFDSVQNLSPGELNLTAQLVDPNDPALRARLPICLSPLLGCATIDAQFPVLITVEPLNLGLTGNLSFTNAYSIQVHTANLAYEPYSAYRLFKAPVNGAFADISSDVLAGSVRARGAGGSFSQFLIVADTRPSLLVETQKEIGLQARILAANLTDALQSDLLGLLGNVHSAVVIGNYTAAITGVDQLSAEIQAHAGSEIANVWNSDHTLANDAGDLLGLTQTLRFTLVRLQNGH